MKNKIIWRKPMKNKINLLEYIYTSNKGNHPLKSKLKISKDFKSFESSFSSKKITVYSEKNTYLEELGREIFSYADFRLNSFKEQFEIEKSCSKSQKKCDLIQCFDEYLFSIAEFKEKQSLKNDLNKEFDDIFSQMEHHYILPFTQTDFKKTEIVFASGIIIDVEKIIYNPSLIDQYYNSIDNVVKSNPEKSLEKYGICILTKQYDILNNSYLPEKTFNIAVTEKFLFNKKMSSLDAAQNSLTTWTRPCIDAKKTITYSSSQGIGNVRERLSIFENKAKKELFFSIHNTLVKGWQKNNIYCLNKESEVKTFLLNKKETSIVSILNNISNTETVFFTSTDAALINGQQSTEIPATIVDLLKNRKTHINNKLLSQTIKELEKNLIDQNNIKKNSPHDIEDFLSFIKKCSFNYVVSLEENSIDVNDIAVHKNNTIPVDKEDNLFVKNAQRYKYISNQVAENSNYLLTYPNCSSEFSKTKKTLKVKNISPIFDLIKNGNKNENNVHCFSKGKSPFKLNSNNIKSLESLIEIKDIKETKKLKSLTKEIDDLKKTIKNNNKDIKIFEIILKNNPQANDVSILLEEVIEKIKENKFLKDRAEKKYNEEKEHNTKGYKWNDQTYLKSIIKCLDLWFLIKECIYKKNFIKTVNFMEKNNIEGIILSLLIKKYPDSKLKLLEKDFKILENDINNILNNIIEIYLNYNFQWTSINNGTEKKLKELIYTNNKTGIQSNLNDIFEKELKL
jgi:hypothetical protein